MRPLLRINSLRSRIFITMILLVLIASVLVAVVTIYQYREQSVDYHEKRLERKEKQILQSIAYVLRETTYPVTTEYLGQIFSDVIYRIADVHNVNFNLYNLEGDLMKSSRPSFEADSASNCLDPKILNRLSFGESRRYVEAKPASIGYHRASYVYINDIDLKPIGILNLPYFEDNSFNEMELREFLFRLAGVYLLSLLAAILLAYFISKYITRSLQTISDKLDQTHLTRHNKKIYSKGAGEEIGKIVTSYNRMIDELEESAIKLARSEREQAWREMAKQVAHEIKNPLTPMRLTVQSFVRKFDPKAPNTEVKIEEFAKSLIQQIDTMSNIAGAFSNFAQMPAQQNETLNMVTTVKLALEIFNEPYIHFNADEEAIIVTLDRTQLIRVVTNLVKNAIQAMPGIASPSIVVTVASEGEYAIISVADNGVGIAEAMKHRVFEPKFTTKSSGMGLGLGMVKNIVENYRGAIGFTSKEGQGTVFTVRFPKNSPKKLQVP